MSQLLGSVKCLLAPLGLGGEGGNPGHSQWHKMIRQEVCQAGRCKPTKSSTQAWKHPFAPVEHAHGLYGEKSRGKESAAERGHCTTRKKCYFKKVELKMSMATKVTFESSLFGKARADRSIYRSWIFSNVDLTLTDLVVNWFRPWGRPQFRICGCFLFHTACSRDETCFCQRVLNFICSASESR